MIQPKWNRCPSVTTGGKPFFWCRRVATGMQHVCWHRGYRAWYLFLNHSDNPTAGPFSSPKGAREAGERWYEDYFRPDPLSGALAYADVLSHDD